MAAMCYTTCCWGTVGMAPRLHIMISTLKNDVSILETLYLPFPRKLLRDDHDWNMRLLVKAVGASCIPVLNQLLQRRWIDNVKDMLQMIRPGLLRTDCPTEVARMVMDRCLDMGVDVIWLRPLLINACKHQSMDMLCMYRRVVSDPRTKGKAYNKCWALGHGLKHAARNNNLERCQLLLQDILSLNPEWSCTFILLESIKEIREPAIVKLVLPTIQHTATSTMYHECIDMCVKYGTSVAILRLLLDAMNADLPFSRRKDLFRLCATHRKWRMLEVLLDRLPELLGADLILLHLIQDGEVALVRKCLRKSPPGTRFDMLALEAIHMKHADILRAVMLYVPNLRRVRSWARESEWGEDIVLSSMQ